MLKCANWVSKEHHLRRVWLSYTASTLRTFDGNGNGDDGSADFGNYDLNIHSFIPSFNTQSERERERAQIKRAYSHKLNTELSILIGQK